MATNSSFTQKFASSIVSTLTCFDRVIFKGHLPFGNDTHLNSFVDGVLRMRRKDFLPLLEELSESLVAHAKEMAATAKVPYQYFEGHQRKESLVQKMLQDGPVAEGLVTVLCFKETCRAVKLGSGEGRPRLYYARRPQRVLYFYFLDPEFGLMHVRLQTMFPYTMQVCINGHNWLAQQLLRKKVGFVQHDNAFTGLDDPQRAQKLADRLPHLPWTKILERWARQVNPLLASQPWLTCPGQGYYWVIDQAELSTDLLFRSRAELAKLYPRLLDHACLHFSAQDILMFLGRRLHPRFDGEVLTTCQKERWPGARIKHRMKNNWLKMYDKFGLLLRIETVINQPREFRVRRRGLRRGQPQMLWCPMSKGVSNFYHYHAVARAANQRYLEALAVVDPPCTTQAMLNRASRPVRYRNRPRRGLNLLHPDECRLFFAVLRGDHYLNGFRNRDVAEQLYTGAPKDLPEKRRRTARVSRLLQLLRAHGFIAKVPRAHRYTITRQGHALMNGAIYLRHKAFPKDLSDVA